VAGNAAILDDAVIAAILAVLLAVRAAQKHAEQQNARTPTQKTERRSSLSVFRESVLQSNGFGCAGHEKRAPSQASQ
jgi:hypothetical protein